MPGSRAGDAALASGVFLIAMLEVVGTVFAPVPVMNAPLTGAAGLAAGIVLAGVQAAAVMLRRGRPRLVYALIAVVAVVEFGTIGAFASYSWPVLAFAVARAPGRATGWLVLPVLGALAGAAVLGGGMPADLGTRLGLATGLGLSVSMLVLIGAAAGRYTRYGARRAEQQRAETERVRRAAALRTERSRMAEEIGSGVLAGLRRLVGLTAAVDPDGTGPDGNGPDGNGPGRNGPGRNGPGRNGPGRSAPGGAAPDLRALRDEARTVLAAMRRVLGVLRAPADDEPAAGDPATPSPAAQGRIPPLPDQAGLVALAAFLAVALPLAALPQVDTGEPPVDLLLSRLELPLNSPVALLAVAAQFAAIAWWRTAPVVAMLVSSVGLLTAATLTNGNLVADCGWLLLVWGASSRAPARYSGPAVLAGTLLALAGTLRTTPAVVPVDQAIIAIAYLWVVPYWVAGVLVRRQRTEAERRRRERNAAHDRDAVAQERLRVARDLHDVVAHHVSAIAVQAGAARLAHDPQARAEALAHIAESGRRVAAALPELAGLTPDPHGVVLDAAGIEHLVTPSRTAGLPVGVEAVGSPADPPGDADLFAQRILTEALTNVLRHAGPTPTRVRVTHGPAQVSVEVHDDGPVPGHRPDGHGSGLGLLGMRERVSLLGGELHAGTADGPGWSVHAVLPRSPVVLADETRPAPISSSTPIRNDPLAT
ncbi:sensor histidine kinase [Pseudonocardia parietis]|uniref:histidine kinase n=1 Tax=Pseudonocardia parietis TaxID=570936 RepID=A0ABS4VXL8_9PSEU|nr:histidine kinase [Pseudonocardia parietis]MBP2368683.1 signal transduction histidine kinase [Pseudonocardia parietis]